MRQQIDLLQKQIEMLNKRLDQAEQKAVSQPVQAAAAPSASIKPGNDLTFQVGGGEVTLYGHADVSLDYQTNGMAGYLHNGSPVTGLNGWLSDVSSNLSFFGIKGERAIDKDLKAVFQFETEVSVAATPGTSDQAPDGTAQKASLGSRNSYVGLQSAKYGAIKLGKTDTPYKTSTGRLDPFASTPGDYNAIIGNSGGDNRAEFDMRLPHSIWYESPKMNGVSFNGLVSPGQNRSMGNGLYAQGEPDCTGGNSSAGLNGNAGQPTTCNDGAFGTAYSAAVVYEAGPLYVTGAYELHKDVNRVGDEQIAGTIGIRNESAFKVGVQYAFPTKTTVNFLVERLKRDAITPALDERTHTATWLAITQGLTAYDDVNFGWAHAGRTPGQPDQGVEDKYGNMAVPGSSANGANLFSVGYKHRFLDKRTTSYITFSRLTNEYWGHYSLGAGGHGLPTRNYVGDKYIGGCQDGGVCGPPFAGNTAQALSVGLTYDF
jgi:predicted porin